MEAHSALEAAGPYHFGAEQIDDQAWNIAHIGARGLRVALLGCTAIDGGDHALTYVPNDAAAKGGAAVCAPERIDSEVATARAAADVVIFMLPARASHTRGQVVRAYVEPLMVEDYASERTHRPAGGLCGARRGGAVLGGKRGDGKRLVAL